MSAAAASRSDVRDLALAEAGRARVAWADREMPVLAAVRARYERERPLAGVRIAASLHVTAETANLVRTLAAGGAEVALCAANPLSTQDDVAATLVADHGVACFAVRGEDAETYYRHLNAVVDVRPQVTMDDGGDVAGLLHAARRNDLKAVVGGTEETTTGVVRLRAMEAEGVLAYPVIAVNEAQTKQLFDNRYGTGQSTIDGILRATNALLAGRTVAVAGYGWCGRGIADRARGMGAHVVVVEIEPVRALQAVMDGFRVLPALAAAHVADVVITATGTKNVFHAAHFAVMRDGTILANAGHFNVEFDVPALAGLAVERSRPRPDVEQFALADGRRLHLLCEGRLVNLGAAEGHPASVMDMSFANQALSVEYVLANADRLDRRIYVVPEAIDQEIARLKLAALGVELDEATAEQARYAQSWHQGT